MKRVLEVEFAVTSHDRNIDAYIRCSRRCCGWCRSRSWLRRNLLGNYQHDRTVRIDIAAAWRLGNDCSAFLIGHILFADRYLQVRGGVVLTVNGIQPAKEVVLIGKTCIVFNRNRTYGDIDLHHITHLHGSAVWFIAIDCSAGTAVPALQPGKLNAILFTPGFNIFTALAGKIDCGNRSAEGIDYRHGCAFHNLFPCSWCS